MQTATYSGWTNYETWNAKLWMDNDEGSYRYWQGEARRCRRLAADKDDAVAMLREQLKDEHEQGAPEVQGFYGDILTAALSEVNWHEIAETLIDDETDEDDED